MRLGKGASAFCYPENIPREMRLLFSSLKQRRFLRRLPPKEFAGTAAAFLSTLNAIHPFREGNGRTQATFLALLADRAGHPLDLDKLEAKPFLAAMVSSFRGDERPLARQIFRLVEPG